MEEHELLSAIKEIADDDDLDVTMNQSFIDIAFDSLQYIDLVMILESRHGISIKPEKLGGIKTIKELHKVCLEADLV